VQQMRGVGMNAWRTSHNPPEPVLLDLTDRLGVLVLDENRVLATGTNCQGPHCLNVPAYSGDPAADMGYLAKRDRNHASVAWYSLCNEVASTNAHPSACLIKCVGWVHTKQCALAIAHALHARIRMHIHMCTHTHAHMRALPLAHSLARSPTLTCTHPPISGSI